MADRTFTFTAKGRTPRPRSKRLRDCGGAGAATSDTTTGGGTVSGAYLPLTGGTVTGQVNFEDRVVIDGNATLLGQNSISGDELTDFEDLTHIYVARGTTLYRITADLLAEYIYEHFNYLNALTDMVRFPGEGGSVALADIVTSNGVYDGFETDNPSLTVADGLVTVGENSSPSAIYFTLTLTYRFADGGTRSVALPCTQMSNAGMVQFVSLTVNIVTYTGNSPSVTINGATLSGTTLSWSGGPGTTCTWSATDGNVTKGGTVTVWENTVINVNLVVA